MIADKNTPVRCNSLEKRCFFVGRRDSLFRQLVASLLVDLTVNLDLYESDADSTGDLIKEVAEVEPHIILLEESSPFSENSLLVRLLIVKPGVPVIVIGEESNFMYIVHLETKLLSSSDELIKAIERV